MKLRHQFPIQSLPVVEMTSLQLYAKDQSLDESLTTWDEKENLSAAQKGVLIYIN